MGGLHDLLIKSSKTPHTRTHTITNHYDNKEPHILLDYSKPWWSIEIVYTSPHLLSLLNNHIAKKTPQKYLNLVDQ